MTRRSDVRIAGKLFFVAANARDARQAEYAIPILVGGRKGMVGITARSNADAKKVLAFLGLEVVP